MFQLGETVAREAVEEAWPERQQEEEEEELEENMITPSQARPAHTPVNKGPKWFPNMVRTFKIITIIIIIIKKNKNIMFTLLC